MDFAQIAQLGIGGVTLFLLMQVWQELKDVNKFNRDMLMRLLDERETARAERVAIMEQIGLDPRDSGIYKRSDLGLDAKKPESG